MGQPQIKTKRDDNGFFRCPGNTPASAIFVHLDCETRAQVRLRKGCREKKARGQSSNRNFEELNFGAVLFIETHLPNFIP